MSRLGSLVRPFGGTRGQLLLDAYDASETRASRIEIVASREGLDVPAQPPAWLAGVLAEEGCLSPGLSPLSDHVGFETAARWLGDSGVRVTRHPSEGF